MLAMQGAIASKRALAPEERPKRLREGAGRMDAPERRCAGAAYPPSAIRHPLSAILSFY